MCSYLIVPIFRYSPLGILSLIASAILNVEDIKAAMASVGYFIITSVTGCLIHQFVILPVMFLIILKASPFKYMLGMMDAILTGMAPPSRYETNCLSMLSLCVSYHRAINVYGEY